ncbi:hypothetical protein D3C71_1795460 [compost metagenome]
MRIASVRGHPRRQTNIKRNASIPLTWENTDPQIQLVISVATATVMVAHMGGSSSNLFDSVYMVSGF